MVIQWAAAAAMVIAGTQALAAPQVDPGETQRNGGLSRHLWSPELGRQDMMGVRFSAGLALGLNGSVQAQLRRNVTPALSLDMGPDSRLSLLPGGRRGAMLVLHSTR